MLDLAQAKLDVLDLHLVGVGACLVDHVGRHIDTDDAAGGADLPGRQEAVNAAAGAQVQHRLAGL